jgi:NMD protein affecting ribosome stability and mRNA decay
MSRRFCANCGTTGVGLHDNFCSVCYWKLNSFASVKNERIEIAYCLDCGSIKQPSGWSGRSSQEEIAEKVAYAFIRNIIAPDEADISIHSISNINWLNPNPEFIIEYLIRGDVIEEFPSHEVIIPVEIKLLGGICTLCVKKKTGADEVTVQFRALHRKLTKEEKDYATKLSFTLSAEMEAEMPSAYISDISEYHGGLDFSIGDNSLGDAIVAGFKKRWIGQHEKNYKLITESKDNKRVYRTTHLFRIPEVRMNDIVVFKSSLFKVLNIHKAGVVIRSLRTALKETTTKWEKLIIPSRKPEEIKKIVISEDYANSTYLLMDLNTYENEEVEKSDFPRDLPVGEEITLLVWEGKYYLPST